VCVRVGVCLRGGGDVYVYTYIHIQVVHSGALFLFLLHKNFINEHFQKPAIFSRDLEPIINFDYFRYKFFAWEIYILKEVTSPPLAHASPNPRELKTHPFPRIYKRLWSRAKSKPTPSPAHTKDHGQGG
jgi:hypothetical protein